MERLRELGAGVLLTGAIAVGVFAVAGYGLFFQGFFAPRFENIRRQTFENSQSYNDGMIQQLQSYYVEYQRTDEKGKEAIRSVVSHQYASYPVGRLPSHLQSFVNAALNPSSLEIK